MPFRAANIHCNCAYSAVTNGFSWSHAVEVNRSQLTCSGVRVAGSGPKSLARRGDGGSASQRAYNTYSYDVSSRIWTHAAAATSNASG